MLVPQNLFQVKSTLIADHDRRSISYCEKFDNLIHFRKSCYSLSKKYKKYSLFGRKFYVNYKTLSRTAKYSVVSDIADR